MTQRVPANCPPDLCPFRFWLEYLGAQRTGVVGIVGARTGENPVSFGLRTKPLLLEKHGGNIGVERQLVLGTFGFQLRDLAAGKSFSDFQSQAFEVDRLPAESKDLADSQSGAAGEQNHRFAGLKVEQSNELVLGQNARRSEPLAHSFALAGLSEGCGAFFCSSIVDVT